VLLPHTIAFFRRAYRRAASGGRMADKTRGSGRTEEAAHIPEKQNQLFNSY